MCLTASPNTAAALPGTFWPREAQRSSHGSALSTRSSSLELLKESTASVSASNSRPPEFILHGQETCPVASFSFPKLKHDLRTPKSNTSRRLSRDYRCLACDPSVDKRFTTENDLDRHNRSVHEVFKQGDRFWKCPVAGCSAAAKRWPRRDNFKSHVLRMHGQQYECLVKGASHTVSAIDQGSQTYEGIASKHERASGGYAPSEPASEVDLVAVGTSFRYFGIRPPRSPPSINIECERLSPLSDDESYTFVARSKGSHHGDAYWMSPMQGSASPFVPGGLSLPQITPSRGSAKPMHTYPRSLHSCIFEDGWSVDTGSDDSEDGEIVHEPDEAQLWLADCLAQRVLISYYRWKTTGVLPLTYCVTQGHGQDASSSASFQQSQTSESSQRSNKRPRTSSQPFRQRGCDKEKDDDGQNEPPPSHKQPSPGATTEVPRLFVCPYHKKDPTRYSANDTTPKEYKNCGSCILRDISKVKQHLSTVHRCPEFYCSYCWCELPNQATRDEHISQRTCLRGSNHFEGRISAEAAAWVKRKRPGAHPRDLWYEIFAILFPGETRPASPYMNNQIVVQQQLDIFRVLGLSEAQRLYAQLQSSPSGMPLPELTAIVVREAYRIFAEELAMQGASDIVQNMARDLHPSPLPLSLAPPAQTLPLTPGTLQSSSSGFDWPRIAPMQQFQPPLSHRAIAPAMVPRHYQPRQPRYPVPLSNSDETTSLRSPCSSNPPAARSPSRPILPQDPSFGELPHQYAGSAEAEADQSHSLQGLIDADLPLHQPFPWDEWCDDEFGLWRSNVGV